MSESDKEQHFLKLAREKESDDSDKEESGEEESSEEESEEEESSEEESEEESGEEESSEKESSEKESSEEEESSNEDSSEIVKDVDMEGGSLVIQEMFQELLYSKWIGFTIDHVQAKSCYDYSKLKKMEENIYNESFTSEVQIEWYVFLFFSLFHSLFHSLHVVCLIACLIACRCLTFS
jgi:cobalamin biosynthesis protein CobT